MAEGLNSGVRTICQDASGNTIFAGGSFTQTGLGFQCNYIAQYISGFAGFLWTSLPGGSPNGPVNAMVVHNGKLYVGGEFTMIDTMAANHIACFDLSTYQWSAVGSIPGNVKALAIYNNEIYAGGSFQDLVVKWTGAQWQGIPQNAIYGNDVRTLKVINNQLYIGGDFELPTGALRKNVIVYDGSQMIILGFGTVTPVNDFELYNNKVYAACDLISNQDTCALAVYDNGDWNVVIKQFSSVGSFFSGNKISSLITHSQQLFCGGDFTCGSMMIFGSNLMRFEQAPNDPYNTYNTVPLLNTDSTINCLFVTNNNLHFGGEFYFNSYTDTVNHIGYIDVSTTDVNAIVSSKSKVVVYPNPAKNVITFNVTSNSNVKSILCYDLVGKEFKLECNVLNGKANANVSNLPAGYYSAKYFDENNVQVFSFVKE
jgi:hypothetical protein